MAQSTDASVAAEITIRGVVQGVGFRPYVQRLAREYRLTGAVRNESGHVVIAARGQEGDIRRFIQALTGRPPSGATVDGVETKVSEDGGTPPAPDFVIADSGQSDFDRTMMTPDIAVCEDCLREMTTPGDPRYRHPFISCISCGPRFSIAGTLPWDRENTTMKEYALCALCAAQYTDEADRRCHAQTVCCNSCGPVLNYRGRDGAAEGAGALDTAISVLKAGGIVAVKGIGGYHIACRPADEAAVGKLRFLKGREAKPFAIMFPDLCGIKKLCRVDAKEAALLLSPARPIVLLDWVHRDFAGNVAGTSRYLGAFLPYAPLQHLILRETGPLVMTSANISSEPIIKDDGAIEAFFETHAGLDGVLSHGRKILRRLDDSVTAVVNNKARFIRRARGYVPLPMEVEALTGCPPLLCCGAQTKSIAAVTNGSLCYPSAELGDLDGAGSLDVYRETVADLSSLFHIAPRYTVCDLHPDYASARYARETGLPVLEVQHHHAHIASVMAEHGLNERVIGVAFDGTGYGPDGTVWGGEFLLAAPDGFARAGHLKAVRLLGGDASVNQCWKTAACYMADAEIKSQAPGEREKIVQAALGGGVNTVFSSSAGRLFDAVAAILGLCEEATYEGQGAVELENAAASCTVKAGDALPLPYTVGEEGGCIVADMAPCIKEVWAEKERDVPAGLLALRFHLTVASLIDHVCRRLRAEHGLAKVCLSGGVFQNRLLSELTAPLLEECGFEVFFNEKVPPNDGGIALGQFYAGGMRCVRGGFGKTD
jgi:hydrogenase maturation protein HypF